MPQIKIFSNLGQRTMSQIRGSEGIKNFWVKQSSKSMIFELFSISFGKFGIKEGFISNHGQRTMSQIRGSEGIKYFLFPTPLWEIMNFFSHFFRGG